MRATHRELSQSSKCHECRTYFVDECTLRQHSAMKHTPKNLSCIHCGKKYNRKVNLIQHQDSCLKSTKRSFECMVCRKTFLSFHNLQRHESTVHAKHYAIENAFECNGCGKKFTRKDNLRTHILKCQNRVIEQDQFVCALCGKVYSKKLSLKWHIQRKHLREKVIRCDRCDATFKGALKHTVLTEHTKVCQAQKIDTRIKCALCGISFVTKKGILHHIIGEKHKIVLRHEHLRFSKEEEFEDWKAATEKSTTTFFRKNGTKHFRFHSVSRFVCHRSGCYEPKAFDRKRRVKMQGTKKIGGFCPAEIILDKRNEDGLCRVSYVSTHLGHNVCDESELAHVYLGKKERVEIASKLLRGVPHNEILSDFAKSCHAKSIIDPSCLLTRKDLNNILRDYKVKDNCAFNNYVADEKSLCCSEESMSVESFLHLHQKSILFAKKSGKTCSAFPSLMENDSVIVVMTDKQKQLLKKYARKVLLADGTFDLFENEFLLQTLLIIDDYDEAIPVAFAISNRLNESFIDVFLTSIKNEFGVLDTQLLMSCAPHRYFCSWKKIMGSVQHHSFYKWPLNELWQLPLKRIVNPEKRRHMQNQLREIATYLDIDMFQAELEELMADTDPDLEEFLLYFRKNFYENVENWAYCYRKVSGVNTNIHAESFNRALKYFNGKLKKIKSFTYCLALISSYLNTRERDLKRKEIRGKLSYKLTELRRRHDEFVKENCLMSVENAHDLGWYISVSNEDSEVENIHFIRECQNVCNGCKLYCEKCDACVHQYQCTCTDNTIRNNMCNHIHALCGYLKMEKDTISDKNNPQEFFSAPDHFSSNSTERDSDMLDMSINENTLDKFCDNLSDPEFVHCSDEH